MDGEGGDFVVGFGAGMGVGSGNGGGGLYAEDEATRTLDASIEDMQRRQRGQHAGAGGRGRACEDGDSDLEAEHRAFTKRSVRKRTVRAVAPQGEAKERDEAAVVPLPDISSSRVFTKPLPATDNIVAPTSRSRDGARAAAATADGRIKGLAPDETLVLEHVRCYDGRECRRNLFYDATASSAVFCAAGLGVVMDIRSQSKKCKQHFAQHHCLTRDETDEIEAMAVCAARNLAATGGAQGRVHIWPIHKPKHLEATIQIRKAAASTASGAGVQCLCFSSDGRFLAVVTGVDVDEQELAVYDWKASTRRPLLSCEIKDARRITMVRFSEEESPPRIVTGGKSSHLCFYATHGDRLLSRTGVFSNGNAVGHGETSKAAGSVTCAAFLPDGATLIGTSSGDVFKFLEHEHCAKNAYRKVHRGLPVIDMLCVEASGTRSSFVLTSGKDGRINIFTPFFEPKGYIDVAHILADVIVPSALTAYASKRAFCTSMCSSGGEKLLLGLSTSDAIEMPIEAVFSSGSSHTRSMSPKPRGSRNSPYTLLFQGIDAAPADAEDDAPICIAMHPTRRLIATCTPGDRCVRLWPLTSTCFTASLHLPAAVTCLDFNRKHQSFLVAGDDSGCVHILFSASSSSLQLATSVCVAIPDGETDVPSNPRGVTAVQFSPCGKYIAVGLTATAGDTRVSSRAGPRSTPTLVLLAASGSYAAPDPHFRLSLTTRAECTAFTSGQIACIDWSTDASLIRANTSAGELLFVDTSTGAVVPGKETAARDAQWASQNCALSYNCCGVWPTSARDARHVSCCVRSNEIDDVDDALIAVTDEHNCVNLYRYPANTGRSVPRRYDIGVARVSVGLEAGQGLGTSRGQMQCAFSCLDDYLVTSFRGGKTSGICVWRVIDDDNRDGIEDSASDESEGDSTDDESPKRHGLPRDRGKGVQKRVMVLAGVDHGANVYEPFASGEDLLPDPVRNHSLAELGAKRGYKSPLVGQPCMTQVAAPSSFKLDVASAYTPPEARLRPSWVYGFRGHDTVQSVYYTSDGYIVYFAGCFGVVLNPLTRTQRHITDNPETGEVVEGNGAEIGCIARSNADKSIFATGETQTLRPTIAVWSSKTSACIADLAGLFRRSVTCLAFNASGKLLAACGYTESATSAHASMAVGVYDWRSEVLLASFPLGRTKTVHMAWSAFDHTIATCGERMSLKFAFGCIEEEALKTPTPRDAQHTNSGSGVDGVQTSQHVIGAEMNANVIKKGVEVTLTRAKMKASILADSDDHATVAAPLGDASDPSSSSAATTTMREKAMTQTKKIKKKKTKTHGFTCVVFTSFSTSVVASTDGNLYMFYKDSLSRVVRNAHTGGALCVTCFEDLLVSGGSDSAVRFWSSTSLDRLHHVQLDEASTRGITSVTCDSRQRVLIGTRSNDILELSDVPRLVTTSHGAGSITALGLHPFKDVFLSASRDGELRLWSWSSRSVLHSVRLETVIRDAVSVLDDMVRGSGAQDLASGSSGVHSDFNIGSEADARGLLVALEELLLHVEEESVDDGLWVSCVAFSRVEEVVACGTSRGHVVMLSLPSLAVSAIIPVGDSEAAKRSKQRQRTRRTMHHHHHQQQQQHQDYVVVAGGSDGVGTARGGQANGIPEGVDVDVVTVLTHSPDNRYMAIGTSRGSLVVADASDRWKKLGSRRAHMSKVTAIDWTADSHHVSCNGLDMQISHFQISAQGGIVQKVDDREVAKDWVHASLTRILSWPSTGIWFRGSSIFDVLSLDMAPDGGMLVTGDSRGLVNVFKCPALGGPPRLSLGHAAAVNTVRFAPSGGAVFTAGDDGIVVEWRVEHTHASHPSS